MDDAGFDRLYREQCTALRAYVRRRLGPAEVDEALSDIWLVVWRRRAELPADPLPWLYGVARRVVANQRRGRSRLRALRMRLAGEPAATTAPLPADRSLAEALGRLSALDREALLLTAWEGLSAASAAESLGCSVPAFTSRLRRARERLRAELDALEARDEPNAAPAMEVQR